MEETNATTLTHPVDGEVVELTVSDETVALEVGYGLRARAQQIHENPDDDFEDVAIELKELADEVIEAYE